MSKNRNLPAQRAFEIRFLPQLRRGKKHFYPHKCAVWRHSRQSVRAAAQFARCANCADLRLRNVVGCFVGKAPSGLFRRSGPSRAGGFRLPKKLIRQQAAKDCGGKLRLSVPCPRFLLCKRKRKSICLLFSEHRGREVSLACVGQQDNNRLALVFLALCMLDCSP